MTRPTLCSLFQDCLQRGWSDSEPCTEKLWVPYWQERMDEARFRRPDDLLSEETSPGAGGRNCGRGGQLRVVTA